MKVSKVNVGLALTMNYDKVVLELVDEPVEYETMENFKLKVKSLQIVLRNLVEEEFDELWKGREKK